LFVKNVFHAIRDLCLWALVALLALCALTSIIGVPMLFISTAPEAFSLLDLLRFDILRPLLWGTALGCGLGWLSWRGINAVLDLLIKTSRSA
jgi:hypothetical protein